MADRAYIRGEGLETPRGLTGVHARLMAWRPYAYLAWAIDHSGVRGRTLVTTVPFLWLILFFLAPFLTVVKISVSEVAVAIPPYLPLLEWVGDVAGGAVFARISLNLWNYFALVEDDLYWRAYLSSLEIASISTAITLVIGFPMAYGIARAAERWRNVLLMLVILPFWTSFLIRVYAWIGILKNEGYLNNALIWLGLIGQPLTILNTNLAVYIGIVYSYLPFMILPLYANLARMDLTLLEAAADLGCRPTKAFWLITVPLARPGIFAGSLLVFIPVVGEFVIPDLLGGSETLMIGRTLWVEFFNNRDWPLASAVAVVMLTLLLVPILVFQRQQQRAAEAGR